MKFSHGGEWKQCSVPMKRGQANRYVGIRRKMDKRFPTQKLFSVQKLKRHNAPDQR